MSPLCSSSILMSGWSASKGDMIDARMVDSATDNYRLYRTDEVRTAATRRADLSEQ